MTLQLRVVRIDDLNPIIRQVQLAALDGSVLPAFTPGAHILVQVELAGGVGDWRHYSLVVLDPAANLQEPTSYTIAIRREDEGRGGSRFMHGLRYADVLTVQAPKNEFPLRRQGARAVLVAGGIGITPLASMAAQCRAQGHPVRLYYAGRSRALMAFLPQLEQLLGDDMLVHEDAVAGSPIDVDGLLAACGETDQLHVCGPKALLDAVLAKARERGWPKERLHFEVFTAPAAVVGDIAFEVVLAQSGRTLQVAADQTLLDCLVHAGCDPIFDCTRGECGVCTTSVLEGVVDHRDYVLSDAERASGKVMQICVSRARTPRLVLDL